MKTIRIKRIRTGRGSGIHHFRHVITLKRIHEHEVIQHMIGWKAFHKNRHNEMHHSNRLKVNKECIMSALMYRCET